MTETMIQHDVKAVSRAFDLLGDLVEYAPYGAGHINDTYAAVYDQSGTTIRYIHQRINHHVFTKPVELMENISRVTSHQFSKLQDLHATEQCRRALTVIPCKEGRPYWRDADGNYWRTYLFIEKARAYEIIESTDHAERAARAFGDFQRTLSDMPGEPLHETIPNFHNTEWRFENLKKAIAADSQNRATDCKAEIEYAMANKSVATKLSDLVKAGSIPQRVTHNDTKLNNVLIDDETGEGICVIDLDTVMPGLALHDFGDMVRSVTLPVMEDEQDLNKVVMQKSMFEALAKGYISSAGEFLNDAERENLAFSGQLLALEVGMRFLTDYLEGDTYFKTNSEGQNLNRTRTQFALARDIERNLASMTRFIETLF